MKPKLIFVHHSGGQYYCAMDCPYNGQARDKVVGPQTYCSKYGKSVERIYRVRQQRLPKCILEAEVEEK